jgi:hypothetical protein
MDVTFCAYFESLEGSDIMCSFYKRKENLKEANEADIVCIIAVILQPRY